MKFESKFGIGEIVSKVWERGDGQRVHDELLEVVAIVFSRDKPVIVCRYPQTGTTVQFSESELTNDPDFSQEHGYGEKPRWQETLAAHEHDNDPWDPDFEMMPKDTGGV